MVMKVRCSAVYPTLAAPDVEDTCHWYVNNLGFTLRFLWGSPPSHGAVLFGEACVHFWQGPAQLSANWLYFDVNDLDAMHQLAQQNDLLITKPPTDYPWGMREFNMTDLNGYQLRFGQHLSTQA